MFSYPTGILEALWSDVVTEAANRILASVCGGDIEPIKALAENPQAGEYARSAALRSLLVLVAQGDKSREEILDYYRSLFRRLPRTDDFIWSSLASAATDLYPNVLYADIRQAFDDDLIDPFYINQGDVDQVMAQGLQPTLQALKEDPFNDYIVDAIAELEMWAAFQPDISPPSVPPYLWPPPPASTTFVREGPKIGRNEPCPCGSGLKYKRCCGRKK